MSLKSVVTQLRRVKVLKGQVAAGAIEQLKDYQFASLPAAFVIPIEDVATENESMTDTYQVVTQRIGVLVIFPTATLEGDRRGQSVAELYDITKFGIFKALLNWNPLNLAEQQAIPGSLTNFAASDLTDPMIGHAIRGYRYEGCSQVSYGLDRIAYEFRFAIEFTITDEDGWQLQGIPLEEIDIKLIDDDTGDVFGEKDLTGLQDVPIMLRGVTAHAMVPTTIEIV